MSAKLLPERFSPKLLDFGDREALQNRSNRAFLPTRIDSIRVGKALCFVICLVAPAALAAERGTVGLVETPFIARNGASSDISCSVSIAHWYSAELGEAAPGGTIHLSFWSDPASGTLYLLNEMGDRMPVQLTWCGFAGRSWETRSVLVLARDRATDLTCVGGEKRLTCR